MSSGLIYAQRPDATACAEYDLWNEKMGRCVRRGSEGVSGHQLRLFLHIYSVCQNPGDEFLVCLEGNLEENILYAHSQFVL